MKRFAVAALGLLSLTSLALIAPWGADAEPKSPRGTVVSATKVAGLSRQQTQNYLTSVWSAMEMGKAPAARYGVDAYRLVYRTIDVKGKPTTASGLVVLPRNDRTFLDTVAYTHGTNPTKKRVASMEPMSDRAISVTFAATGFGTVAPDYLGLGKGRGRHPYMHHASEATASEDMLTAAKTFGTRHDRVLSSRVRVLGFSQGGPAAMELGRRLQAQHRLAALAPIGGPFAVEDAEMPAALTGRTLDPAGSTFYIGYWVTSMNRLYHFYDKPSQAFQAPYDKTVEALFDGSQEYDQVMAGLPGSPEKLLTPEFAERLKAPTGELAAAMRDNDHTCNWAPKVPVRIYAARGDRDVTILNSRQCELDLRANGVEAEFIDLGDVSHNESAFLAVPRIAEWFSTF